MGINRNAIDSEESKISWKDKTVCPWYICGFCPHDLFTNTKEDLDPCPYVHSDSLREEFQKEEEQVQGWYEQKFLRFLKTLQSRGRSRVSRAHDRLQSMAPTDAELRRQSKEIFEMRAKVVQLDREMEELGEKGEVQEAQKLMPKKEALQQRIRTLTEAQEVRQEQLEARNKKLVVCDICGGFVADETEAMDTFSTKRSEAHKAGRLHQGFSRINDKCEELEEKLKGKVYPSPPREEKRRSRSKDRRRRRRDRSRSRDRGRRRNRDHRDRDRERGRDRDRDRGRSRRR